MTNIGGSNFNYYSTGGAPDGAGMARDPYGVIKNYNNAKTAIDALLWGMYTNGQRRLRLIVYHANTDYGSGTIMASAGGTLTTQHQNNLFNLLTTIKAMRFQEVVISFGPQGANIPLDCAQSPPPFCWSTYDAAKFAENWGVIASTVPIIASVGIPYKIDLLNEGIPPASGWPILLQYAQNMWATYYAAFGAANTVGLSLIPDGRESAIASVYSGVYPPVFDVHFYTNSAANFASCAATLAGLGLGGIPWIIGETYYNDLAQASTIKSAIAASGKTVDYLVQWPIDRNTGIQFVPPPLDYTNYLAIPAPPVTPPPVTTPATPAITSSSSSTGAVGTPLTFQIKATNSPTSYAATGLPPWLALNSSTGLLSGTPTSAGPYSVNLTATNAGGTSAIQTLSMLIGASGPPATTGITQPPITGSVAGKVPQVKVNGVLKVVIASALNPVQPNNTSWDFIYSGVSVVYNWRLAPLQPGDVVQIIYPSPLPWVAIAEDLASIAAVGLIEATVEAGDVKDKVTLQAIADEALTRGKVVPKVLTYKTRTDGYKPGQRISVVRAELGINDNFLITGVTSNEIQQELFEHTVVMANGASQFAADPNAFMNNLVKLSRMTTYNIIERFSANLAVSVAGQTNPGLTVGPNTAIKTAQKNGTAGWCTLIFNSLSQLAMTATGDVITDVLQNGVSIFGATKLILPVGFQGEVKFSVFLTDPLYVRVGDVFTFPVLSVAGSTILGTADPNVTDGLLEFVTVG